ncbi:MAG TPA: hypothetical protein DCX95_06080 [Elusimicrobia bacterium]|nr:hypothetical protein [Elusimicrobiota bacterium]
MRNKKIKLFLIFLTVLIAATVCFLFHKKQKIVPIELNTEKLISSDVSVIIRFDDLEAVWSDFKKTNFYVHFKDFFNWFLREMPSETLGFTNDIKDIQKNIGFEIDEKNILNFIGKRILIAMWLENPDDKKFLLISRLNSSDEIDKIKIGIDEYRGIKIDILDEDRYWCIMDNKFVMSNDLGTIRKVIDFSTDTVSDSVTNDIEFKKNIIEINSSNYIYIKSQKITPFKREEKFDLMKNEVKIVIFSMKFEKGIRLESYIFQSQPSDMSRPDYSSDLTEIFAKITGKNHFKFMKPVSVEFTPKKYGSKTVIYLPITDLSSSEWFEIFSGFRKILTKKILFEREKITRKNLISIREALNIYNSKTARYPTRLGSLIDEYINEIPQELLTKSNSVTPIQDATGGWFYSAGKVYLNVSGTDSAGNFYTNW